MRPFAISTVADSLYQTVAKMVLEPRVDPCSIQNSMAIDPAGRHSTQSGGQGRAARNRLGIDLNITSL
jgi:hypothetical protein